MLELGDILSREEHRNSGFYCACCWHLVERYQCDSLSNHHVVEDYPSPVYIVFWHLEYLLNGSVFELPETESSGVSVIFAVYKIPGSDAVTHIVYQLCVSRHQAHHTYQSLFGKLTQSGKWAYLHYFYNFVSFPFPQLEGGEGNK